MAGGLARHGAAVHLWGRTPTRLEDARDELSTTGPEVSASVVDVSDESAVVAGVDELVTLAWWRPGLLHRLHDGGLPSLDGSYLTMREVCRAMVATGCGGSIITVASVAPSTVPHATRRKARRRLR